MFKVNQMDTGKLLNPFGLALRYLNDFKGHIYLNKYTNRLT